MKCPFCKWDDRYLPVVTVDKLANHLTRIHPVYARILQEKLTTEGNEEK